MAAVTVLKDSVLRHAQAQEDHLYKRILEQMQPDLRALVALSEFMDAQKTCAVDASPPAVAQFLHHAMT